MKNVSTKNRGVRALIVTGVAGAGLLLSGLTGSIAESRPLQTIIDPCQEYDVAKAAYPCYPPNTRNTIPENQTSSTTTTEATTTTTTRVTTTTEGEATTTTTAAPGSTTTTAPAGVAGAGAARPVAAQASYTG